MGLRGVRFTDIELERVALDAADMSSRESARLADVVGGGVCGLGPRLTLDTACLQAALSRLMFARGDAASFSRLADAARGNLLAVNDLLAREAAARGPVGVTLGMIDAIRARGTGTGTGHEPRPTDPIAAELWDTMNANEDPPAPLPTRAVPPAPERTDSRTAPPEPEPAPPSPSPAPAPVPAPPADTEAGWRGLHAELDRIYGPSRQLRFY